MSVRRSALLGLLALVFVACPKATPIVRHQTFALDPGALVKVAVVPFYPVRRAGLPGEPKSGPTITSADLVAHFVAEAMQEEGIQVIAPNDVVIAFEGVGQVLPRQDVGTVAALLAEEFGATAVVLGTVSRYRDRSGEALGSRSPASVHFELTLYRAPGGERLWGAHFDQTQPAVGENLLVARQYPGFGTRWLSAAELARWGAKRIVDELPEGLW